MGRWGGRSVGGYRGSAGASSTTSMGTTCARTLWRRAFTGTDKRTRDPPLPLSRVRRFARRARTNRYVLEQVPSKAARHQEARSQPAARMHSTRARAHTHEAPGEYAIRTVTDWGFSVSDEFSPPSRLNNIPAAAGITLLVPCTTLRLLRIIQPEQFRAKSQKSSASRANAVGVAVESKRVVAHQQTT